MSFTVVWTSCTRAPGQTIGSMLEPHTRKYVDRPSRSRVTTASKMSGATSAPSGFCGVKSRMSVALLGFPTRASAEGMCVRS